MSAIFFVQDKNFSNIKENKNNFSNSLNKIKHRGNQKPEFHFENNWCLGFIRLKTSSKQTQPYYCKKNNLIIAIDGEIYNEKELCSVYEVNSANINETISEVYKKNNINFFKRINGMFVIIIIDLSNQKIFIVKDKLGLKPLFYFCDSQRFIFSSEIKSISNYLGGLKVDYANSINSIFMCGRAPYTKTHFKDIYDLEQSTYLEYNISTSKIIIKKYFDISEWVNEGEYNYNKKRKEKELSHQYYDEFYQIIRNYMTTELEVGNLFSAGLDSSMVGAIMSEFSDKPINLYYFESEINDYSYFTRLFCDSFNAKLIRLKTEDKKFATDLPNMIYHYESTAKEEGAPIMHLASQAVKNNNPILLTGDGDTIIGGSATHSSYFVRSKIYNNRVSSSLIKIFNILFGDIFNAGVNPSTIDYLLFPSFANTTEVMTNILLFRGERLGQWQKRIKLYEFIKDKTERESQAFTLDDTLYRFQRYMIRQERSASRHSAQFRYPYLDDSIIKISVNMPYYLKQRFRFFQSGERFGRIIEAKSVARNVARIAKVPNKIINRNEVGSPFNSSKYLEKLISKWNLECLAELVGVKEDLLKKAALESHDPWIDRLRYSFLSNEILIRIFENGESPQEIQSQFEYILK